KQTPMQRPTRGGVRPGPHFAGGAVVYRYSRLYSRRFRQPIASTRDGLNHTAFGRFTQFLPQLRNTLVEARFADGDTRPQLGEEDLSPDNRALCVDQYLQRFEASPRQLDPPVSLEHLSRG